MKNIFLKETDQETNLYKSDVGLFYTKDSYAWHWQSGRVNQFIYITNDEKIEDGNWVFQECLNMPHRLIKTDAENVKVLNNLNKCKKIILTTDQDLIKDGVQQVSSSFLSFYAENQPDYVEIFETKVYNEALQDYAGSLYSYKFPRKEIKTEENVIDQWLEKSGNSEIMKQVEREAELYQTINKIIDGGKNLPKGFEVALEVAEKLYTEEDLHNTFYNGWIYRG